MAIIIRIVTFIITLFFIIILLLGATTSFSTEWYESDLYPMKFRVLSPKELLIDQLNIQNEFKEIESHEEWTERAYLYYPLVEFDDDEDVYGDYETEESTQVESSSTPHESIDIKDASIVIQKLIEVFEAK